MSQTSFKFKIGEIVLAKTGIEECRINHHLSYPAPMMITERRTQECPGGIQIHYLVSSGGKQFLLNEIELAKLDEFDSEAAYKEMKKKRRDL